MRTLEATLRPATLALLSGIVSLFLFSVAHLGVQTCDAAAMLATAATLWEDHTLAIPHLQWLDYQVDIGRQGPDNVTPFQLTSDDEVLEAADAHLINLVPTDEVYRCSVIGPKL